MKRNLVELTQTLSQLDLGLIMWPKISYSLTIRIVHGVSVYYKDIYDITVYRKFKTVGTPSFVTAG